MCVGGYDLRHGGADLSNLVNEAALLAVRRNKKKVGMPKVEETIYRVVAGLEKKIRLINPKEREIVAYHEMGHAIIPLALPGTDPVQKISIIPQRIAALDYTKEVPTEERILMQKTKLINKIAALLGSRAAGELVFEYISTGAHNNLVRVTDIAAAWSRNTALTPRLGRFILSERKERSSLTFLMKLP